MDGPLTTAFSELVDVICEKTGAQTYRVEVGWELMGVLVHEMKCPKGARFVLLSTAKGQVSIEVTPGRFGVRMEAE